MLLPAEERGEMLLSRIRESASKEDPYGTWEVYHILRIPMLSDLDIMRALDAIAESHPLEIDSFIRDSLESDAVVRKGLEIFARQGRLFLVFDLCESAFGMKSEQAKGPILDALRALASGSCPTDEEPVQILNRFMFTAAKNLDEGTQIEMIKALADRNIPQPLVSFAANPCFSLQVRMLARGMLNLMEVRVNDLITWPRPHAPETFSSDGSKAYGKRRRMLN